MVSELENIVDPSAVILCLCQANAWSGGAWEGRTAPGGAMWLRTMKPSVPTKAGLCDSSVYAESCCSCSGCLDKPCPLLCSTAHWSARNLLGEGPSANLAECHV